MSLTTSGQETETLLQLRGRHSPRKDLSLSGDGDCSLGYGGKAGY